MNAVQEEVASAIEAAIAAGEVATWPAFDVWKVWAQLWLAGHSYPGDSKWASSIAFRAIGTANCLGIPGMFYAAHAAMGAALAAEKAELGDPRRALRTARDARRWAALIQAALLQEEGGSND